ncbi:MAG: lipid A biosynthesis acyltransferase [Burkholderiales bacterium]|nr:lipid A biosynthesis acyltransferase [Burkholderiales bacterium]
MSRFFIALLWLVRLLPARAVAAIGAATGAVLYWLIPERRRVTRVNLTKCFPAMPARERERLARKHFRAFCRGAVDHALLWWAPRARIERLVRVEGLEHLRAAMSGPGGTPVILFVPHFVGLDAGATRLACEADCTAMYARQKDPLLDELLRRGRTRFGDQRIYSRQEGIQPVLARMREGRPLYYLPDQDYGPRDAIFVPFFGVPAATIPGLSRIARLARARVLPCVTHMLARGAGYVLRIEPAWDNFPTDDAAADTRRMNAYIERCIASMPEQYNWMHKRFKTRPAGEAGFY